MSNEVIDDGGQAFPTGNPTHGGNEGMTLRDYFAGQALVGFCAGSFWAETDNDEWAKACYTMADAMLKARNQ